jgi:drug/metabolite transporter (DMT)-like permease
VFAISLALCSSLCWGVADFTGGTQARRAPLLRVMLVSQGSALAVLCVVALIDRTGVPSLVHLLPAVGAGAGGTIALAAFYRALAIGKMSIVAPISSTAAIVPVAVGMAGGDRPQALQLAGIVAAIVGVVLASREPDAGASESSVNRMSIMLALVAALGFGGFFVGMRASSHYDVLWALLLARVAGVTVLAVVAGVRWSELTGRIERFPLLAAAGLLDLLANALYALATRHGLLSVVAVLSSLYPLVTVLLARAFLGERVARIQELGIAAAVAGVAMIAAG